MSWAYGIGVTIGIMIVHYAIMALLAQLQVPADALKIIEMVQGAVIVLGSAYWVYVDSQRIEISKYEGVVSGAPQGLAVVCVLLWLLFLPAYLQKRWLIKNHRGRLKPECHPNYRKPS